MAYVANDDIIAFIQEEINVISGNSQTYDIILYKDYIGTILNLNQPTSFGVAVFIEDRKVLQYAEPPIPGVSSQLTVDRAGNSGKISFNIDESQSLNLGAGTLSVQVSVFYENYYPQSKSYVFPILTLGSLVSNSNPNGGGNNNGGNNTTTIIQKSSVEGIFQIEAINGSNPNFQGSVTVNSKIPSEVTSIIFKNLDSNGIRLSSLENFLINRVTNGAAGVITIFDMEATNMYAIYGINSWERLDLIPGGGDDQDVDGIKIYVNLETRSTGPGVTRTLWEIGQEITFQLDANSTAVGLTAEGILTFVDKNINPIEAIGNYSNTGIQLTYNPYASSYINVEVNGITVEVGDGNRDKDSYFSNDGGDTASNIENILAGYILYWNGDISGYNLEIGDEISLTYEATRSDII